MLFPTSQNGYPKINNTNSGPDLEPWECLNKTNLIRRKRLLRVKPAFSYMDWVETLGVYYLCHSLNLFLPGQTCMFKSRVRIFGDDSCPGDSPGKNTGVGCHFILQCMKVKSECEVAQSYPTLSDPMDWSPPGSSIHGIFQARVLEWGAICLLRHTAEDPANYCFKPLRLRVIYHLETGN